MKINDNKEIFMEVRFGDLKPGDTICDYDDFGNTRYYIKWGISVVADLQNGDLRHYEQDELVIPVEITANVK